MSNHPNSWTAEDDELLRELWEADAEGPEMAEALERSTASVFARASELHLPRRRSALPWTRADLDTLRRLFERGLSDAEIAARFDNRSLNAIVRQRANLGLIRRSHQLIERPEIVVGPARTCQWIEGDHPPGTVPPVCGRPSVDGRSYCAEHARRAYRQPGDPRPPRAEWRGRY